MSANIAATGNRAAAKIKVDLQDRSYDILIGGGLLAEAGGLISALRPGARCAIVTDENVARHHLEPLERSLAAAGLTTHAVTLPAGEATKCLSQLGAVVEKLLSFEIERGDLVVALGGGVIGDLAGFAASILRRGVDFVQIPTSLLAQVDSSVGGKTGINSPHGKNLIGAFHQPILVLCDMDVLGTLEPRQFRAGYAEVVKYGLIRDADFFEWLGRSREAIYALETEALTEAIRFSCAMKAAVVAEDEKEHGLRALLNLGHTFGHGFEALTGYSDRLLHGEAISIGMVLAFEFSERLGLCPAGQAEIVARHFTRAGLPTRVQDISGFEELSADALFEKMRQDKKVERGRMVFILARRIGEAFVSREVTEAELSAFLTDKFAEEH